MNVDRYISALDFRLIEDYILSGLYGELGADETS
jgi:hypothetical protein